MRREGGEETGRSKELVGERQEEEPERERGEKREERKREMGEGVDNTCSFLRLHT